MKYIKRFLNMLGLNVHEGERVPLLFLHMDTLNDSGLNRKATYSNAK